MFPYGSFALLAGPALFYPPASSFEPPDLETIVSRLKETDKIGLSLEPKEMDGLVFVVPLWREAGLSGVILLGSKQDGGPYTQEEIEIAQATGERLIDGQASVEMTRRLIALQRRHLVAGQVADQRVRRLVHDETLPLVHTVMLTLAGGDAVTSIDTQVLEMLEKVHRQLSTLLQSIPVAMAPEVEQDGLVVALQHIVGDELRGAFDEVKWQIDPKAEEQARALTPLSAEVFYSAAREGIRNAARHGRGEDDQSRLCLRIAIEIDGEDTLRLTLEDNGVGLSDRYAKDTHPLQLFHEGLRGVELHNQPGDLGRGGEDPPGEERAIRAGSGQGLVLHSTLMAVIGGSLTLSSRPGVSTCLTLELPRAAGAK
jgi:signal transduction histidine kinase